MMFILLDEEARVDIVRDESRNVNYAVLDVIDVINSNITSSTTHVLD
jgi:hypothetical protein